MKLVAFRCRASAGAFGEDPYQVLGLPQDADSKRIDAAYRKKKREAELAQNQPELDRIEAAHSALFMRSLSSRLETGGPADKRLKYADRQELFPWRPRLWQASKVVLLAAAAVYGAILAFNLLLTTQPQGVVPAAMAGFILNSWKQYQLFPVDSFADQQEKMDKGWKNILRGALLAIMATAVGVFGFYTLPDLAADVLGAQLPIWFYEGQLAVLTIGACVSNFLFTGFTR